MDALKRFKDRAKKLTESERVGELRSFVSDKVTGSANKKIVKIKLISESGDKLHHNSPILCTGVPTGVRGTYHWYRMRSAINASGDSSYTSYRPNRDHQSSDATMSDTSVEEIHSGEECDSFEPNESDTHFKIACMWIPHPEESAEYQHSSMVSIGPLKRDPSVFEEAQTMLNERHGEFEMELILGDQKAAAESGDDSHSAQNGQSNVKCTMSVNCRQCKLFVTSALDGGLDDESHMESSAHESSILPASMARKSRSMGGTGTSEVLSESKSEASESSALIGTIWQKPVKIKAEWYFEMSRKDNREFTVYCDAPPNESEDHSDDPRPVFRARAANAKERDIWCIVVGALARKRREKRDAKMRSNQLVRLDIQWIGDHQPSTASLSNLKRDGDAELLRQLHEKEKSVRILKQRNLNLEQEKTELKATNDKLNYDLDHLRLASKLKTESYNELSKEHSSLIAESEGLKKEVSEYHDKCDDLEAQMNEFEDDQKNIEDMKKDLLQKEKEIAELKLEISDMLDDKKQMQQTLNHLNVHVSKVQTERSLIDDDLGKISEEKVLLKSEAREYKLKYDTLNKEFKSISSEFESHQRKCKFDMAQKDSQIYRLKTELEQSNNDLNNETEQSNKQQSIINELKKKLDRSIAKNGKLATTLEEYQSKLSDSILKEDYQLLKKEHSIIREHCSKVEKERNDIRVELSNLQREYTHMSNELKMTKDDFDMRKDEFEKLQSHNQFYKQKLISQREELQKLYHSLQMAQSQPTSLKLRGRSSVSSVSDDPPPMHSEQKDTAVVCSSADQGDASAIADEKEARRKRRKAKIEALIQERDSLLGQVTALQRQKELCDEAIDSYKKALDAELNKSKKEKFSMSLFRSQYSEDLQSQIKKNRDLQMLANEFSDTVADKEQLITHLKQVTLFLGDRIKEVEQENVRLRQQCGIVDSSAKSAIATDELTLSDTVELASAARDPSKDASINQPSPRPSDSISISDATMVAVELDDKPGFV